MGARPRNKKSASVNHGRAMTQAESTQLRGFDSYRVTLGDEMRGLRATMGKSLLDVQRDLRIKAAHIAALENADPTGVPHKGYLTGYLRAYARYLGMDQEDVLRRFCEESGFVANGPNPAPSAGAASRLATRPLRRDDLDAAIAGSRLAAVSRAEAISGDLGATLRGLGSLAALAALVWGLGYGGWAVLQNIQRVDFAPQSQAPGALADAPDLGAVGRIARASAAPPIIDPAALAAVYAAQDAPPPAAPRRDGPIAAIDPAQAGVYASGPMTELAMAEKSAMRPTRAAVAQEPLPAAPPADLSPAEANLAALEITAPSPAPKGVALVFAGEAWVRVRDGEGGVMHEALMQAGERWAAPQGVEGMTLRAGNAGGVYVEIDGAYFGPLGRPGEVVSGVVLSPESVPETFPEANAAEARVSATRTSSLATAERP